MSDHSPEERPSGLSSTRHTSGGAPLNPRQHSLWSLFVTTTICALFLALAIPLWQRLSPERKWRLAAEAALLYTGVWTAGIGFAVSCAIVRRRVGTRQYTLTLLRRRRVGGRAASNALAIALILLVAAWNAVVLTKSGWPIVVLGGVYIGMSALLIKPKWVDVCSGGLFWPIEYIPWEEVRRFWWQGETLRLRLAGGRYENFVLAPGQREQLTAILRDNVPAEAKAASDLGANST